MDALDSSRMTPKDGWGRHPAYNIRANGTSQKWTPFEMLPESGSIPRKLAEYLPSTRLQGGEDLVNGRARQLAHDALRQVVLVSNLVRP